MSKIKVGDKVRVIGNEGGNQFPIGSIVELTKLERDGIHDFSNGKESWYMVSWDYEIINECKIKVGDKVRVLDVNYPIKVYGIEVGEELEVEIVESRDFKYIGIRNDNANFQIISSEQVELVIPKYEVVDEIGYTIVTGLHFGSSDPYSWICDRELFDTIELNDLIVVDTKFGDQVVQVIEKKESLYIGLEHIGLEHKKVIRKLEN